MSREDFETLVSNELIPYYCQHKTMGMVPAGFKRDTHRLSDADAEQFMRAWQAGIIHAVGNGCYYLGKGGSKEKFFWEGARTCAIRPFSLWLEPIITAGRLARLHLDYHWPQQLIGSQSIGDWAFDIVTFTDRACSTHQILCEVKKTGAELRKLDYLLQQFSNRPELTEADIPHMHINAFRKIRALRKRQAPVLWLAGPSGHDIYYQVHYHDDGRISLMPGDHQLLFYPSSS